jgi:hypothetical protein
MKRCQRVILLILIAEQGSGPAFAQILIHHGPGPGDVARYGDSPGQLGYFRIPEGEGPFPAAIAIHGGCFLSRIGGDSLTPAAGALVEDGIAT